MNFVKKGLALGMAVIVAGSLGACSVGSDTNWVAKTGDTTVSAGVYIWQLMNQYYDAQDKVGTEAKDPLKEQIDGVPVSQWMMDGARKDLDEYLAVEQKFTEMGLAMDELSLSMLNQNVEGYWEYIGAGFEKNGISKDSYGKMTANDMKKTQIFQAIYGEGGTQPVPESELKDKFVKDYAKVMIIPLDFSSSTDPVQKESDSKAAKEMIEKYYQKAKSGGDMEEIVYEAQKEVTQDETLEKPEPGTSFTFVSRDSSPYAENVTEAIFNAKNGEPTKVESETTAYLFVRYDVAENETDFISRKSAILQQLKKEEFDALVTQWAGALTDVTYNEAAFKRYTPSKLKME